MKLALIYTHVIMFSSQMQQFVHVSVSLETAPAQKIVSVIMSGKETLATLVIETTSYLTK